MALQSALRPAHERAVRLTPGCDLPLRLAEDCSECSARAHNRQKHHRADGVR